MIKVKKASLPLLHFPILMRNKVRDSVWLFTSPTVGICLDPSGGLYEVGETETNLSVENFEPYRGIITMENTK